MSFKEVVICFKVSPVAKGRPRFGNGRVYTPKQTKDFETRLRMEWRARKLEMIPVAPTKLEVWCYLNQPKKPKCRMPITKPDADNYLKAIVDALNGLAWKDDNQLTQMIIAKRYAEPGEDSHILVRISSEC